MAYSLNDVYRPLRIVMRVNGAVVGLGFGLLLLLSPQDMLADWGVYAGGSIWTARLSGALLVSMGVTLILAARERIVSGPIMVGMSVANGLIALVLLIAYLQLELTTLALTGRLVLVVIFLVCLTGAVFPLRFVRAEYRHF